MDLAGRNVVVLGLGITGLSLARHLVRRGARVRVADTREAPPLAATLAQEAPGVPLATGPFADATFAGADLVAISPGIAKDQRPIARAAARGIGVVGDIELFARALPHGQKVLAITGSNGKTTVTSLTGALAQAAGLATRVAGNIGDPVLDVLAGIECDGRWPDLFVLELSSFQLETTSSLSPLAATVLNVTENHLDRYPDFESYAAAKARIFMGGGMQVLNRDDAISLGMRLSDRVAHTFGESMPAGDDEWGLVGRGGGNERWLAHGGALLMAARDLRLVGRHNALNALAALALLSAATPIRGEVLAALARFEGLPHRMQRVTEAGDVLFVNDSKGTTVAATRVALEGLGRPAVLIAGGDGKGQDFTPLRAAVDAQCRAVLLIGRDAPAIERALAGSRATVERVDHLDAAVSRAMALARPGDAVLLSPACASLDQFANYVERGERFEAQVRRHTGVSAHA